MYMHVYMYVYIETNIPDSGYMYVYMCHRHGIGDIEKMMGSCVVMVIVNISSDAGKFTDELDVSSVHVLWFSY